MPYASPVYGKGFLPNTLCIPSAPFISFMSVWFHRYYVATIYYTLFEIYFLAFDIVCYKPVLLIAEIATGCARQIKMSLVFFVLSSQCVFHESCFYYCLRCECIYLSCFFVVCNRDGFIFTSLPGLVG